MSSSIVKRMMDELFNRCLGIVSDSRERKNGLVMIVVNDREKSEKGFLAADSWRR